MLCLCPQYRYSWGRSHLEHALFCACMWLLQCDVQNEVRKGGVDFRVGGVVRVTQPAGILNNTYIPYTNIPGTFGMTYDTGP